MLIVFAPILTMNTSHRETERMLNTQFTKQKILQRTIFINRIVMFKCMLCVVV